MNQLLKKFFLVSLFLLLTLSPVITLAAGYGLDVTAERAGLNKYGDSVSGLVGSVIGTALSLIGVVFFLLMVYGGFLWMTDHGKEEQVTKAKDTITAAVIGMVVVLASYAITNFVFSSVSGKTSQPNGESCSNMYESPDGCTGRPVGFACTSSANGNVAGSCQIEFPEPDDRRCHCIPN